MQSGLRHNRRCILPILIAALLLSGCAATAQGPVPTVQEAQAVPATTPPTAMATMPSTVTPVAATAPVASPTASLASTIPLLDLTAAWGSNVAISKIPVAIAPERVFGASTITPDAKYLVGTIRDRKADPERFQDIEPIRFGLLEIATGQFTEIRRMETSRMQPFTSVEAADDAWVV